MWAGTRACLQGPYGARHDADPEFRIIAGAILDPTTVVRRTEAAHVLQSFVFRDLAVGYIYVFQIPATVLLICYFGAFMRSSKL